MSTWSSEALAHSRLSVYWNETVGQLPEQAQLSGAHDADLVVVGAGFSGLWAALQAAEEAPGRRIAVVEAESVGYGASSRNGGFCEASLTHGPLNGQSHWPTENLLLTRLGEENLDGLEATIRRHSIACDFYRSGVLNVATHPWQVAEMEASLPGFKAAGIEDVSVLDAGATRAVLDSPTYVGGLLTRQGSALVNPAQLAVGLAEACRSLGVSVWEESRVTAIERDGAGLVVRTDDGHIAAQRAIVATNAYAEPIRTMRRYVIPVYDHVLMTEPLSREQMTSIGWERREGIGDWANQFHYYRLTDDDRILWGGYDATYHFNNQIGDRHDDRPETHAKLARHFFETFPQLEGLRFTHRWGGPIASSTRFTAAWGSAYDGRATWVAGYTGLGVGASRFGARVALDLVDGRKTERTELSMVRDKPFPFPPEPLRSIGIGLTKRALIRADANEGREGLWLKLLNRFGVGFDS